MSPEFNEKLYPYPHKRKDINGEKRVYTPPTRKDYTKLKDKYDYNPPKLTIKDLTERSCSNCGNKEEKIMICTHCTLNPSHKPQWKPIEKYKRVFEIETARPLGSIKLGVILEKYMSKWMPCNIREISLIHQCGGCGMELKGKWLFYAKDGKFWCKDCFYKKYGNLEPKEEIFVCEKHDTCVNKKRCPEIHCRDHSHYIERNCKNCGWDYNDNCQFEENCNKPFSAWKPKESSERKEKACKDCNHLPLDKTCNVIGCYNYSAWEEKEKACKDCRNKDISCSNCVKKDLWMPW